VAGRGLPAGQREDEGERDHREREAIGAKCAVK